MKNKNIFKICLTVIILIFSFYVNLNAQDLNSKDAEMGLKFMEKGIVDESKKPTIAAIWMTSDFFKMTMGAEKNLSPEIKGFIELIDSMVILLVLADEKINKSLNKDKDIYLTTNTKIKIKPLIELSSLMDSGFNKETGSIEDSFKPFVEGFMIVFPVYQQGNFLYGKDVKEISLNIKSGKRKISWKIIHKKNTIEIKPKGTPLLSWFLTNALMDLSQEKVNPAVSDKEKIESAVNAMGAFRKAMAMYLSDNDNKYPPLKKDCSNFKQYLSSYTFINTWLKNFDGEKLFSCEVNVKDQGFILKGKATDSKKTVIIGTADGVETQP